MEEYLYLDNAATCPIPDLVKKNIVAALDIYGNPSSLHSVGAKALEEIEVVREKVKEYLHKKSGNVIFTSGATEANNLLAYMAPNCSQRFLTSNIEHPSLLKANSFAIQMPVNSSGEVPIDIIPDESFISIMTINNEIGSWVNKNYCRKEKNPTCVYHTDATQVGSAEKDLSNWDMITLSGHKLGALKGIGAMWYDDAIQPYQMFKGGEQESGLRAGTENTVGIMSLGYALDFYKTHYNPDSWISAYKIAQDLYDAPFVEDVFYASGHSRIVSVTLKHVRAEPAIQYLDYYGIAVSGGSACSSHSQLPSYVLKAIGRTDDEAKRTIRISLPYWGLKESDRARERLYRTLYNMDKEIGGK